MDAVINEPLSAFDTGLANLISSLQTSPTYATAPAATESLHAADDSLTSALSLLERHQKNHAHILQLQKEAVQLEDKIRSIVTKAGDFRKQLDGIAPGVLDEDSEDEDEDSTERSWEDVDYNTLLNFSRAVGKYNADADKEAEQQGQRLRIEARKKAGRPNGVSTATNGVQQIGSDGKGSEAASQILDRAAGWLNQTTEDVRVIGRMAFPGSERLRLGILGQLQATREEHGRDEKGEEAVEREIERLIATAEGREIITRDDEDHEMEGAPGYENRAYQASGHRHVKKEEKKALDLDLWNESDDDDG